MVAAMSFITLAGYKLSVSSSRSRVPSPDAVMLLGTALKFVAIDPVAPVMCAGVERYGNCME